MITWSTKTVRRALLLGVFLAGSGILFNGQFGGENAVAQSSSFTIHRVSSVTILVKDQEEALRWYRDLLGFEVRQDDAETMPGFRWLTVAPPGQKDLEIVLLPADPGETNQVGKGLPWVLETDDCRRAYETLAARGVKFVGEPEEAPWGVSANFVDLYGNPYNLVQRPR